MEQGVETLGEDVPLLEGIRTEKKLSDELTESLVSAIGAFNEIFAAEHGAAVTDDAEVEAAGVAD